MFYIYKFVNFFVTTLCSNNYNFYYNLFYFIYLIILINVINNNFNIKYINLKIISG